MVYFSTYANPLYSPSDLRQIRSPTHPTFSTRGFTAAKWTCGRRSRPLSLSQPRRSDPSRPAVAAARTAQKLSFNITEPSSNTKIISWRRSDIAVGQKFRRGGDVAYRRCITYRKRFKWVAAKLCYSRMPHEKKRDISTYYIGLGQVQTVSGPRAAARTYGAERPWLYFSVFPLLKNCFVFLVFFV